jgi:hypothetical protein
MGLVVASTTSSRIAAMIATPMVIAPFIIFTPYALPYDDPPSYMLPLKYISPFWWSFTGLAINEFKALLFTCTSAEQIKIPLNNQSLGVCMFRTGTQVLSNFHMKNSSNENDWDKQWECVLALCMIMFGYRILAYGILKYNGTQMNRRSA